MDAEPAASRGGATSQQQGQGRGTGTPVAGMRVPPAAVRESWPAVAQKPKGLDGGGGGGLVPGQAFRWAPRVCKYMNGGCTHV